MAKLRSSLVALALLLAPTIPAAAGPKAAIFRFELIDVSIDGELRGTRVEETQRLDLVTQELRQLAVRDGGYELVDLSGLTAEIEKAAPLHKCGGCEVDIAHRAGAEIAITGTVRKVSNLILGFTIQVRDVSTGRLTRVLQAEYSRQYGRVLAQGHSLAGREPSACAVRAAVIAPNWPGGQ